MFLISLGLAVHRKMLALQWQVPFPRLEARLKMAGDQLPQVSSPLAMGGILEGQSSSLASPVKIIIPIHVRAVLQKKSVILNAKTYKDLNAAREQRQQEQC